MLKVRDKAWRSPLLVGLLVLLGGGCGPALELGSSAGPAKDEVCERFFAMIEAVGGMTASEGTAAGDAAAPQAIQHREQAAAALAFAQGTRGGRASARQVAAIEEEAGRVLDELPTDATDSEAQAVAEPLYRATTDLYVTCVQDLYRSVLTGEIPLTGACAAPGAPTLEGPRVVHYGSGGQEFIESTCELREGVPIDDGCSFPGGGTLLSAEDAHQAHASVEVAYDPDTCRALYESGPVEPGALP